MSQNKFPKISIITPSYNQGRFIEQTILSVLNQKYPNLEYIIIDGGSTDGSVDIIRKYESKLSYWISEKDNGQYEAINKGFSKSTGQIMAFLNADDLYLPWTLKTVASIFSTLPEIAWLTSLAPFQMNSEGVLFASGIVNPVSKKAFLNGHYIPFSRDSFGVIVQEGTFWTKSLWEKCGANINIRVTLAGDFNLWCRYFEFTEPYCIGYPLAAMTRHKDQRSNMRTLYIQQCNDSLSLLRKKLNYNYSGWKKSFSNICRYNKLTWFMGRRFLGYNAWVIDSTLDGNFNISWNIKKVSIYIR